MGFNNIVQTQQCGIDKNYVAIMQDKLKDIEIKKDTVHTQADIKHYEHVHGINIQMH